MEKKIAYINIELWERDGETVTYEDVNTVGLPYKELCMFIASLNRIKNELIEDMEQYDEMKYEPKRG